MTTRERVETWARAGIDMEMMTMILRSDHVPDSEIADAYGYMATLGSTEIERGQYYMRIDRT